MFWSYVKIAARNVIRQKLYSAINILGLAIGVAACITILLYVQDELSYDRYHEKADRIYRVSTRGVVGGNEFNMALSSAPVAATLVEEFPEVEMAARIGYIGGYPVLRYGDKAYSEELLAPADSNIFDIFDIKFIHGDAKTALTEPNSLVLTQSAARRYFGDENPMGKIMTSDRVNERMVTGVIEDFPHNSHFHYDFLLSFITYQYSRSTAWLNNNLYTYIVLKEGASPAELEAKFPDLLRKYVGPQIEQALGVSWDQMREGGANFELYLQSLTDIHLRSHLDREIEINGNITYIYVFSLIAVFILIIACINFMNLATARSEGRAREVGVRKTLGSNRGMLVRQFLVESVALTFTAVVLAVIIVLLILPWFNNLVGLQLAFRWGNLPWIVLGTIVVGILAGSYPAFFLSAFNPVLVLRSGGMRTAGRGSRLRSSLVVFQFTISIILFTGTILVRNQLNYMQNKELGFDPDNLLVVQKTDDIGQYMQAFKQELIQHTDILELTNSTVVPGEPPSGESVLGMSTPAGDQMQLLAIYVTDFDFAHTYGIEMAEGRFFSSEFGTDSNSVVINEAAMRAYGVDDPIGRELIVYGGPGGQSVRVPIIGVMKDFHFESLHSEIRPMVIIPFGISILGGPGPQYGRNVTMRINPDDLPGLLAFIEDTWTGFAVDQAFEYVFMDDHLNSLYQDERRTRTIATLFSVLAIFVACLGLLGLASFTAERRTKEVGIRKVLGATVAGIFGLLSSDILKLVGISALISLPVSYYVMNNWLENFAYRVNYSLVTFIIASIVAMVISILTITWQVLKVALANPVDSLRYE